MKARADTSTATSRPFSRLMVLGCGGFYPAWGRHTMCFLLTRHDRALLLDAGSGIARLAEPQTQALLEGCERLEIVLTHYHQDHVAGLPYLVGVWDRPIRIWAPSAPLVDTSAHTALDRLLAPPFFPIRHDQFRHPVEITSYDGDFELLGLAVRTRRQQHPGGSVGLRIADEVAYVTDTVADANSVELAGDIPLLLHEVWCNRAEATADPRLLDSHSAAEDVLDLASKAGVQALLPIHHHPRRTPAELNTFLDQLEATASTGEGCEILRLLDGEHYDL